MSGIRIIEREMTPDELNQLNEGFAQHDRDHDNPVQISERIGHVLLDGDRFIGCASGLAYKNGKEFNPWFQLTDLFIARAYRGHGHGKAILRALEARVVKLSIANVWTWTAGYEAPEFYKKQGYTVYCEMDHWYASGHSRVGLIKRL